MAEVTIEHAEPGDVGNELLVAELDHVRGLWFFAEPRDSDLAPAQLEVDVAAAGDGVDVTLTARSLVRDATLLVDKVRPEATAVDGLVTLLPGESRVIHVTRPHRRRRRRAARRAGDSQWQRSRHGARVRGVMTTLIEMLGEPVCGMTWGWVGVRGTWGTADAAASLTAMADHAVNWAGVAYAAVQATPFSTDIPFGEPPTVTDDEIVWAIRGAKQRGMKVVLKPVVNCADGTWRAHIGFFDWDVPNEPTWTQWFESYSRFILHAARIAEVEGCEMLCIGCEMVRADGQDAHWRRLVADVRTVYSGLVTYNCDKYQEDHVTWWDAVDVISSSGYYPIGTWRENLDRIERVVAASGKPFLFMEAGCPSRTGSADVPNDWSLPGDPSGEEQLRYYRAMLEACRERPWVGGLVLWDWPARLYDLDHADENDDYCPYGKPAGQFLRRAYTAWRADAGR